MLIVSESEQVYLLKDKIDFDLAIDFINTRNLKKRI